MVTAEVRTEDGRLTSTPVPVQRGEHIYHVRLPEIRVAGAVHLRLLAEGGRIVAAETVSCRPTRRWTVYIMPTSHIDLYSTGLAHETPEEHARIVDAAVAQAAEFPHWRYQIEHMLPVFEYRELRTKGQVSRLVEAIRGGQIAFGAQYTGLHHEEASAEEWVQGQLLHMRELEAAYGIRPNCGYTVDVPNTTLQYPQLLARCGIPCWIFSPNRYPPPDGWYGLGQSMRRLPPLVCAQALDGSVVLTWLPHEHYGEELKLLSGEEADMQTTIEAVAALLAGRLHHLEGQGYPWDAYLLEFSYGDNLPPTRALPLLVAAWQERYAFPRLVLATADQFFRHVAVAEPAPPTMPLQVLDVWAFVVANQGVLNMLARRAARDLTSAQALWSLSRGEGYPEDDFREAFGQLAKFGGHDWWYGGEHVAGIPDLAKADWAHRARTIASAVLDGAVRQASAESKPPGTAVVNPCAFARRDVTLVPAGVLAQEEDGPPCQVVDGATAATHLAPQPYTIAHPPESEDGCGEAAVLVVSLPSLGQAALRGGTPRPSRPHAKPVIETKHYRAEFAPERGAVGSIVDKESGQELLRPEPHGFGQLLLGRPQREGWGMGFVGRYEEARERMRGSLRTWEPCHLELEGGLGGPVFSSLLLRGHVHTSPVTEAIILYEDLKRIDVTITVEWDNDPRSSRLVVAFPFALDTFVCRYEVPFGVLEVGRDETPTVPRHLRLLQGWLQFSRGDESVVLASPDVGVLSLGRCDLNPIDDGEYTVPERATAYLVLTDNGAPSPLVQPGRLAARFSLTSGRGLRPADCARFAWGFARPFLVSGATIDSMGGIEVKPDSLLVSAVKRAWDGRSLVVRVVEYDGAEADAALCLPFPPRRAWLADPTEHPVAPASLDGCTLRFSIGPYQVLTWLIEP